MALRLNEVNSNERVAILIPTRNRPKAVEALLESISQSSLHPSQIVIVSSGQNIEGIVEKFSETLPITYEHTEVEGQIAQKRNGIKLIHEDIEWCVFLDDDLLIEEDTLQVALSAAKSIGKVNVIGIGLALPPTSRFLNSSKRKRILARLFGLTSDSPGKVLASGHATSYLQENSRIETQWLNGASMWRTKCVREYGTDLPSTPYAACEDLIFSYPLSKLGTLMYVPEAKVSFQESELSVFDSFKVLESASLWRYYFVRQHKELSVGRFFISQIARSVFALSNAKSEKVNLFFALTKLNFMILLRILSCGDPKTMINKLVS